MKSIDDGSAFGNLTSFYFVVPFFVLPPLSPNNFAGNVAEGGILPRGHVAHQPLREGVGGMDGGGAEHQARDRAQQRPRRADGNPWPHGARANQQHPLRHQRNPRLSRDLQLSEKNAKCMQLAFNFFVLLGYGFLGHICSRWCTQPEGGGCVLGEFS